MDNLAALREALDAAETAFDTACKPHYCDGRWGAYRAIECGQAVPRDVESAFDAYHTATYDLERARYGGLVILTTP